jgi:hypothetical protein
LPPQTAEHIRLSEIDSDIASWRRWGPYLSSRAWGTVREDYSDHGEAWDVLTHDLARSTAYRWGEDGIGGISDRYQVLCFAPAFWNGRDPILKERLFGLVPREGNHGEDVKEVYYFLDNIPSHAYMRFLYKYPQEEYPYVRLIAENQARAGSGPEFELFDTGTFDGDRYFDTTIEYAKAAMDDIVIRIEATNRGPDPALLEIIPQVWFRNTWSWSGQPAPRPRITLAAQGPAGIVLRAETGRSAASLSLPPGYLPDSMTLAAAGGCDPLFTDNETNPGRGLSRGCPPTARYFKDAIHRRIIHGERTVNPMNEGTKVALRYRFSTIGPGESAVVRLRLSPTAESQPSLVEVDDVVSLRRAEADEFYRSIHPNGASDDERQVQRQALAGLLWNKQSYLFDVDRWLDGDDRDRPPPSIRLLRRNYHWRHLNSMRVLSMPDNWEYPWFASWDLAFHCVPMALVDPQFAMEQLWTLLFEQFLHPSGQLPAYEWEFSDTNPPVHAWAVWRVYNMARLSTGRADRAFLERCFHKLLMNFSWWVNKVDREGNNVFEGGFLGLDNIAVLDRSMRCPEGSILEQSDAAGWMGMFSLNMMRIALELAKENPVYQGLATKFFQHYVYIAAAMKPLPTRPIALWDDRDGFFYDLLRRPDGSLTAFRVRSLVGLIPLFAVERLETKWIEPFHEFRRHFEWFVHHRPDLVREVVHTVDHSGDITHVLTIVNAQQLVRILQRLWDPGEFLAPHGIRSLSRYHSEHPFEFEGLQVGYEPAEAETKIKGGNSNWRGPIWLPTCFLLIESLRKLAKAFGADFPIPVANQPGQIITFKEMSRSIADRLISIFTPDPTSGMRPAFGPVAKMQNDPHWRDHILFHEYFNGDNGQGLGASHQTGWTALVASLIDEWREH